MRLRSGGIVKSRGGEVGADGKAHLGCLDTKKHFEVLSQWIKVLLSAIVYAGAVAALI